MIIDKEKQKELAEISEPLIKWLAENFHPHVEITVTNMRAELKEGVATHHTTKYIKD